MLPYKPVRKINLSDYRNSASTL